MIKYYLCEECGIVSKTNNCPQCLNRSMEIRVTYQGGSSNVGGSLTQGNCQCGEPVAKKGTDDQGRNRYRNKCSNCHKKAYKVV